MKLPDTVKSYIGKSKILCCYGIGICDANGNIDPIEKRINFHRETGVIYTFSLERSGDGSKSMFFGVPNYVTLPIESNAPST